MFWTDRTNKLAGVILLLLALGIILSVVFTQAVSDADVSSKKEIADYLRDIQDSKALAILGDAFSIAVDSVIGIAAAAAFYLVFRDRNRVLATFGLLGLLAGQIAFIVADAGSAVLIVLSDDLGAGNIAAGRDVTLEVARTVGILSGITLQIGFTALAFGIFSIGALIAWAPAGAVNPPRWLGWLAIVGAVFMILSWLIALTDAAFVLFLIGNIATLVLLIVLGLWLLLRAPEEGAASPARAAA